MHFTISKVAASRKARLNALENMAIEREPKVNRSGLLQRMCVVPGAGYASASVTASPFIRGRAGAELRQVLLELVTFATTGPNPGVLTSVVPFVSLSQRLSLSIQENDAIPTHYRQAIGLIGSN